MGGVGLFLRSDIVSLPRSDISIFLEGVFESVFVEVIDEGRRFIVRWVLFNCFSLHSRNIFLNVTRSFHLLVFTLEKHFS